MAITTKKPINFLETDNGHINDSVNYLLRQIRDIYDTINALTVGSAVDHGTLAGLTDDDHVAYWRAGVLRTGDFSTSGTLAVTNDFNVVTTLSGTGKSTIVVHNHALEMAYYHYNVGTTVHGGSLIMLDDDELTLFTGAGLALDKGFVITTALTTLNTPLSITGNTYPTTTGTYNCGGSSNYWLSTYSTNLYLNSTAILNGTTAGQATITGHLVPNANNTYDLGVGTSLAVTTGWRVIYGQNEYLAGELGLLTDASTAIVFGSARYQTLGSISNTMLGVSRDFQVKGALRIGETSVGYAPTYYTIIQGGDQSADLTLTLPTGYAGANNYVLASSTAGVLTWISGQTIAGLTTASSPTFANLTDSGLTATRLVFAGTGGILSDDVDLKWDGTYLRLEDATSLLIYNLRSGTDSFYLIPIIGEYGAFTNSTNLKWDDTGNVGFTIRQNVNLYSSADNILTTDDSLVVGTNLTVSTFTTAGVVHNAVTTGLFSSSLIVNADITANTITYASLQQVSATARVLGNVSGAAGNVAELTAANLKTMCAYYTSGDAITTSNLTDSGLTATRIPYASTGGLLVDSANLIWDNANARLGIGTSAPAAKLHIDANAADIILQTANDANIARGSIFWRTSQGTYRSIIRVANQYAGNDLEFSTGNAAIAMILHSNAGMSLGGSYAATLSPANGAIIQGKVGIGMNSPVAQLDVSGATNLDGAVVINETGADADTRIEGDTDADLLFIDASTDKVGIGTNAPAAKLDINSDSFILRIAKTPANAGDTGVAGQICRDASYV